MSAPYQQGIFGTFGTLRPKNSEQTINDSASRFWGYSPGQDGYFGSTHITPGPKTPIDPWPALDGAFDVPMIDSSQRRRSSAISPRTINALPHAQSHLSAVPHAGTLYQAIPQFFVPGPDSRAFKLNGNSNGPQQPFSRTSGVSIPGSPTLVSISSSTDTDSTLGPTSQLPFFSLLLEICTEGLRRKWQEQILRQQMQNLTARREANGRLRGYHRCDPYRYHRRNISLQHRAGRGLGTGIGRTMGGASMGAGTAIKIQTMKYVRLIADNMWENAISTTMDSAAVASSTFNTTATATAAAASVLVEGSENSSQSPFQVHARAERAALEEMQNLYSLSSSVVRAVEHAAKGETVYNVEEVKDLLGCAGRLCKVLGYWEGEATVEECGRECIWEENGIS